MELWARKLAEGMAIMVSGGTNPMSTGGGDGTSRDERSIGWDRFISNGHEEFYQDWEILDSLPESDRKLLDEDDDNEGNKAEEASDQALEG